VLSDIPRIPGWLGVIFRFIGAARNEIRSQPPSFAVKSSGCSAREAATRCFAFIEAHLSRRRLSDLTPSSGHTGVGGADSRAMSIRISANGFVTATKEVRIESQNWPSIMRL
jgi:hypothetical protein